MCLQRKRWKRAPVGPWSPAPPPSGLSCSAGRPTRGSRWVLFSQTAADRQSAKPANLQPKPRTNSPPTLVLCAHTLRFSLFISSSPSLSLSLPGPGERTPAARSSGDKSDLPGRVVVKHPPGRLRPPHPFNSSAGTASREGARPLHAAA